MCRGLFPLFNLAQCQKCIMPFRAKLTWVNCFCFRFWCHFKNVCDFLVLESYYRKKQCKMKLEEKQLIKQLNQKISLISISLDISAQILLAYSFASLSKGALHFDGPDQNQWPIKVTQIMMYQINQWIPPQSIPFIPLMCFDLNVLGLLILIWIMPMAILRRKE